MSQANIEKKMDEYFVKKAPFQIPENGKKTLVNWIPYLALIFGVLSALAAIAFWNAGHDANDAINQANELGAAYGIETRTPELGIAYYVSLFAILAEAALLLVAYPGLKVRSKSKGWNLLLYGVGASLAYGLLLSFTIHGSFVDFVSSIIAALIGLYILAQIKSHYSDSKPKAKK